MSELITVKIVRKNVSPGRTERTGATHSLYAFWEQNGRSYKTTICCSKEIYHDALRRLVERVDAAAKNKGALGIKIELEPELIFAPKGK